MRLRIKILLVLLFFSLIFLPKNILARSGCCSHHSGVCGCSGNRQVCCDGTFSPSCTCSSPQPTVKPTSIPKPILVPTKVPTVVSTKTPTVIPTNIPSPTPTLATTPSPAKTPILTPTLKPTKTEEISPTSTPQPQILGGTDTKKSTEPLKTSDYIITFSILGLFGFGIYKLIIKIKKIFKKND